MSSEDLVESFVRLISKLDIVSANTEACKSLKRKYRSVVASNNTKKKEDLALIITSTLTPLYHEHRDDVLSRDFGFFSGKSISIDSNDISSLYENALDSDDDAAILLLTNELLYLFYQIAPKNDQEIIDERYKKQQKAPVQPTMPSQAAQPQLAKQMEKMLQKNKGKLKRAENDPSAIPDVLADLFKNNSGEMAGMLTGMLGVMGVDPSQMKNK